MAKLVRGGQTGSLDHINSSQATFRAQISALADAVRQLGGNAEIGSGAVTNDPLNAPYVLYVNPYTGSDAFVGGNYSTSGSATQRIELQRLECGYTEARPFKTINRAIIEAGIITAKSFYESPLTNNDLVSIILAPGVYTIYNGTGAASVSEWAATKSPSTAELTQFNDDTTGGVILPRGVSLCGLDLRKTIFRPDAVPSVADETSNASNRRSIFKVTGTGYYFGFTFMDKAGSTASHHLLHAFEFASQSELDEFYTKIRQAFGGTNNTGGISDVLAVTRSSEYEIVGPQPSSGSQTINTDTTLSASPYIFNCSIRSNYGLCGLYADGAKTSGFRSLVIAQFTGVSLQRDLTCWQKYDSGEDTKWSTSHFTNYADYISTPPDNVRMHPSRRSFHIRAVNNAVIQEVSVFAIGQGVHHWTQSGGEITITNSNSNFGGCAAISEGYRTVAASGDTGWTISRIRVGTNLTDKENNVQRIYLGTIESITNNTITLTTALGESSAVTGVPDIVASKGYTLRSSSRVWVENPLGVDWSSTFTSSAWSSGTPKVLRINSALQNEDADAPEVVDGVSSAVGKRVYIRRLVDTRTPDERRFSLRLNNTSQGRRTPVRDYVLQVDTDGPTINRELATSEVLTVAQSGKLPVSGQGVYLSTEVVLRRGNPTVTWTSGTFYQKGDTVTLNSKHYTCITANSDTAFDVEKWQESFVHMASDYNPEDFFKNDVPIITFDNDTDSAEESTALGYNLTTVWTTDALVQAQYRSGTDYKALHLLLTALGFTSSQAHTILVPKPEASRERDPSNSSDMGGFTPNGAANSRANWPVEFRRPSVIRLFGHAWEWTGYLNYTKAIPAYQGDLSPQNKFGYYFTNVNGGRVYATGFNEEGFQVTPRGLEDVTTGTTLSVENLGSSDLTLETPTDFSNVTLNGTTTINDTLLINATNVTFPSSLAATTTSAGVGEIASISEIESTSLTTTDSGLNSAGNKFVTAAGLKYWASWAKVLTQRTTAGTFYVVPDNAVNGGTYNFDGTSATLTADPNRSGSAISTDPPITRAKAVKFSQAVAYANANYSTLETVNYRLANGPYWTSVTFNTIANVYGAMAQFPADANGVLADFTQASTKPANTDVKALMDNLSAPVFATPVSSSASSTNKRLNFYALPASLNFRFGGTLRGIIWATLKKTLTDSTNFPDSLFGALATYRAGASGDIKTLLESFIAGTSSYDSTWLIDQFRGGVNVFIGSNTLSVRDCVFGAKASGLSGIGYGGINSTFFFKGSASLTLSGIYLLGNTYLPSLTIPDGKPIVAGGGANVYGCRNTHCLVASREETASARDVNIQFLNVATLNHNGSGSYDRNINSNCIHILDDNGCYGLMANRTATDGTRGATMKEVFGEMAPGSRIFTGGYGSWHSGWTNANKHHGIAGVFGDDRGATESGQGPVGINGGLDPLSFYRFASYHPSLWQQATTGTQITYNTTLTYAAGTQVAAWDDSANNVLNIRSSVFFRGTDIDTGQIVGGALGTTTVSGTSRSVFYG